MQFSKPYLVARSQGILRCAELHKPGSDSDCQELNTGAITIISTLRGQAVFALILKSVPKSGSSDDERDKMTTCINL